MLTSPLHPLVVLEMLKFGGIKTTFMCSPSSWISVGWPKALLTMRRMLKGQIFFSTVFSQFIFKFWHLVVHNITSRPVTHLFVFKQKCTGRRCFTIAFSSMGFAAWWPRLAAIQNSPKHYLFFEWIWPSCPQIWEQICCLDRCNS